MDKHINDLYNQALKDYDELQARIDKVIECLEEGIDFPYYDDDTKKYLKGMKDILKGSDKE